MRTLTTEEKRAVIRECSGRQENVLDILLTLQDAAPGHCIDEETAALVASELRMSEAKVYEIITFYAMLRDKPAAEHILEICNSTPCHFTKSDELAGLLEQELGIRMGEATADGKFALRFTPCVGACDIGPVIKVGERVYGRLDPDKVRALLAELRKPVTA